MRRRHPSDLATLRKSTLTKTKRLDRGPTRFLLRFHRRNLKYTEEGRKEGVRLEV